MYAYEWDPITGGYLLNTTSSVFSKEPRPVYYKELDNLGLDKYWDYEKNDEKPYMWAEANSYYYRGVLVAKTRGGSFYNAPDIEIITEPEMNNGKLKFVDISAMVEKNRVIMDALVNETIKRVYNTYMEYKSKIDVFYVAFSGGKDSVALLDIVQKALPHNSFKVLFGDTGMENIDTYNLVNEIERICTLNGIEFLRSKSHLDVSKTWVTFGYPSAKLRWCCSVHKTTPQIVRLRDRLGKPDFTGMAFLGVRKDESLTRAKYDTISEGEKHEGQYSFNVIDEWNSAELFLHIYGNNLLINEGYKKGNSRVGCLVCPMSSGRHEYMKRVCYPDQVDFFISKIKEKSNRQFEDSSKEQEFIENGGWKVRNNGRDLKIPSIRYEEILDGTKLHIVVAKNKNWKEWTKTIGHLISDDSSFRIIFKDKTYLFDVIEDEFSLEFILEGKPSTKQDIQFLSLFRSALQKSAYCIKCKTCEANCRNGYITFFPDFKISDECKHCFKCHYLNDKSGCLLYNSLKVLKGEEKKMSLDSYASFGVEKDWVNKYLEFKEGFWKSEHNDLGSMKITALKRFLRDAKIKLEVGVSDPYAIKLDQLFDNGIEEEIFWALLLSNLAYAPQLNWYIKNINPNERYLPEEMKVKLGEDISKGTSTNIISSLKNIFLKTPIGKPLGLGECETDNKGSKLFSLTRRSWTNPEPRVILYGLYKFAEACGDYYQFTLSRLMNYHIDSDGVSPSQIFSLDRDTMERLLNGLAINYPQFISVSFTLDLDKITLRSDKTSLDVLELF